MAARPAASPGARGLRLALIRAIRVGRRQYRYSLNTLVRGKNCPGVRYSESENNSATRATIHKWIGVRESLREELSHTPIRL